MPRRNFIHCSRICGLLTLAAFTFLSQEAIAASRSDKLIALDKRIAAVRKEINSKEKLAKAMQYQLMTSYKSNNPVPTKKWQAMGVAGVGAVGAGKQKHPDVKEVLEEYESVTNPQNYMGLKRIADFKVEELKRAQQIPDISDKRREEIGASRAQARVEIIRNGEFVARLRVKVKHLVQQKMEIWHAMGKDEREVYSFRVKNPGEWEKNDPEPEKPKQKPSQGSVKYCPGHTFLCDWRHNGQYSRYKGCSVDKNMDWRCDKCGLPYMKNGKYVRPKGSCFRGDYSIKWQ